MKEIINCFISISLILILALFSLYCLQTMIYKPEDKIIKWENAIGYHAGIAGGVNNVLLDGHAGKFRRE